MSNACLCWLFVQLKVNILWRRQRRVPLIQLHRILQQQYPKDKCKRQNYWTNNVQYFLALNKSLLPQSDTYHYHFIHFCHLSLLVIIMKLVINVSDIQPLSSLQNIPAMSPFSQQFSVGSSVFVAHRIDGQSYKNQSKVQLFGVAAVY